MSDLMRRRLLRSYVGAARWQVRPFAGGPSWARGLEGIARGSGEECTSKDVAETSSISTRFSSERTKLRCGIVGVSRTSSRSRNEPAFEVAYSGGESGRASPALPSTDGVDVVDQASILASQFLVRPRSTWFIRTQFGTGKRNCSCARFEDIRRDSIRSQA